MKLGPKQEQWLSALESNKYVQCYGVLEDYNSHCCALGVLKRELQYNISIGSTYSFAKAAGMTRYGVILVTEMNDKDRLTFPQIAEKIRNNPQLYFLESK